MKLILFVLIDQTDKQTRWERFTRLTTDIVSYTWHEPGTTGWRLACHSASHRQCGSKPVYPTVNPNPRDELWMCPGRNTMNQLQILFISPVLRVCLSNIWRNVNSKDGTPGSKHCDSQHELSPRTGWLSTFYKTRCSHVNFKDNRWNAIQRVNYLSDHDQLVLKCAVYWTIIPNSRASMRPGSTELT